MTDAVVNILLLEDEPAHAEAIRRALEASDLKAVLHVAGTLREYREAVAARPPDIALLDLVLPDGRALDVLTSLPEACPFPILIWTSYGDEQTAVEAIKAGALDYIVKSPEAFATMPHAVERALREWNVLQERKRAEEARRESEERFRILFESSHDAIMTLEPPSWNFTSGNPAALAMFRAKNAQEFISFGHGILSPERQPDGGASVEKAQKMIEAAMRDGSRLFEWTHARTDGTEFPATVLLTRMEQDGKVFLQATVRDITEQKREDEALRESEERFRFIFDNAIDGMLLMSLENQKIISANRSMSQMLGYSLEELKKLGTADIHPKEELPYVREQIDIQSKDGLAPAKDLPMRRKDGSVFYANVRGAQIILSGKKYLMGVFRDITERKQAEAALRESEKRYRELFGNVPVGLYRSTPGGTTLDANPALSRMLGYPDRESIFKGNMATHYANPEDRERWKTALEKNGVLEDFENKILRQDGKVIWVKDSARVVKDDKGRVLYYEGALVDFTERKKAEEELSYTVEVLRKNLGATIQALGTLVETRDPYTAGHQRRVADLARAIAKEMGLSQEQVDGIRMAGLIHDIGKVSVPAEILSKPGQLTELEFGMIKIHPQYGYEILKPVEFPGPVTQTIIQHHERINGSGYPSGLKDEEILIEAKILAVADVVEAMISHRPYRPAHSLDQALEEITKNSGALYDPKVVEACLRLFVKKGFTFREKQSLKTSPY